MALNVSMLRVFQEEFGHLYSINAYVIALLFGMVLVVFLVQKVKFLKLELVHVQMDTF